MEEKENGAVFRPWGKYEVLILEDNYQVKRITVFSGKRLSLQYHLKRSEHWVVASGEALVDCYALDAAPRPDALKLCKGEHIFVPCGYVHRLTNNGEAALEVIEVQNGDYLGEDDIIRLEDDFKRV